MKERTIQYNHMLEKDQFHNMSSSNNLWKQETIYVLYKDSFHAFLATVASSMLG